MKKIKGHINMAMYSLVAFAAMAMIPTDAMAVPAQTTNTNNLGAVFTNLITVLAPAAQFITGAAYVAGVGFGIAALLGFKNHSEQPQQVPMKQPMIKAVVAVCLVYFGYFLQNSAGTIFGAGAATTGVAGF